jgi:AraC family transcriptional regulator
MIKYRIIEKPAFDVIGKKTWISGQDNSLFGQFWAQCQQEGLLDIFTRLSGSQPGSQTKSSALGISCVEKDPSNRAFYYFIAIEKPGELSERLETYHVPASQWAVFECVGKVPESIVKSEIYAFTEWLPASGYEHAKAPEMEVYFPGNDGVSDGSYCEFWLPISKKAN